MESHHIGRANEVVDKLMEQGKNMDSMFSVLSSYIVILEFIFVGLWYSTLIPPLPVPIS